MITLMCWNFRIICTHMHSLLSGIPYYMCRKMLLLIFFSQKYYHYSYCFSVAQSCPALCDPMDCSTPGFPVLHYPGVCSNSCALSRWCYLTVSCFATLSSSCLQPFPASGSFPVSQFFVSGGQGIGASASTSVLPMNIQGWFPLGLTSLISLQSKGSSRVFNFACL